MADFGEKSLVSACLPACQSWTLSSPAGALTASLGLRRSLVLVMHAVEVKCDSRVGRESGERGRV